MRTVGDAGPYGGPTGAGVPERRGEAPRAERCGVPRGGNSQHPSVDLCILSLDGESMAGVWGGSAHPGTNHMPKYFF